MNLKKKNSINSLSEKMDSIIYKSKGYISESIKGIKKGSYYDRFKNSFLFICPIVIILVSVVIIFDLIHQRRFYDAISILIPSLILILICELFKQITDL
ncbi:hypothetical protein CDFC105_71222 [Clostridioides difficile]|nr:hypothetical protein CDFC105_64281 [Clostridioides difficile]CZS03542.1 hypothetical protein CDFC105_71222 [Clostridioides difficile]